MGQTPKLKVFNARGEYVAAVKFPEDGAAILAAYGPGSTLRLGHAKETTLYTDGLDGDAGQSYDDVAAFVNAKLNALAAQVEARRIAREALAR